MRNPRVMGLPPLILGVLMLQSSVGTLLETPFAWADFDWLLSVPGTVFGLAATLLGLVVVLGLGDRLLGRTEA